MPFVPGAQFDVFISYAWADNQSNWVSAFEKSLKERLHVLLGKEPAFWRDVHELSGEQDFTDEIKLRLGQSATMVAVLSPAYFHSRYCTQERAHFQKHAQGGPRIGNRHKLLKATKLPHPQGLDRALLQDAFGFSFHSPEPPAALEFTPGERGFSDSIEKLARGALSVLEEIRNSRLTIYLGEGVPTAVEPAWLRLRTELERKGFRVLPDFRATEIDFAPEVLEPSIQDAALAVHLLAPTYSPFAAAQLQSSLARRTPAIAWVLPNAGPPDARLEELLTASLEADPPATVLRNVPLWQLETIVIEAARKQAASLAMPAPSPSALASGPLSVYLICDRTDPEDTAEAAQLARQLESAAGVEVHLPEAGRDPAILDEIHQQRLAQCDAVLFYLCRAHREFLVENYGDVVRCLRRSRAGKPYQSLALLLGPGAAAAPADFAGLAAFGSPVPVLTSLRPFLAKLQAGAA
jgi:hypothetical protein